MSGTNTVRRHCTDDEVKRALSVNILEIARQYGFAVDTKYKDRKSVHLLNSGGLYLFPNSNRYYQHTNPDNKGSVINFVMWQDGITYPQAVAKLIGEEYTAHARDVVRYEKKNEVKPLPILPVPADNNKQVIWYLTFVRGIDPEIVNEFIGRKMIYQTMHKYQNYLLANCVFVAYDNEETPRYCALRGASEKSKFRQDIDSSDKSYPFYHEGKSDLIFVNEAPIDMMSHATLAKIYYGLDWRQDHRVALGCLGTAALDRYLQTHPEVKRMVFGVDNDYLARNKDGNLANWGQLAAARWCRQYTEKGFDCAVHVPHLKDFNLDLIEMRKGITAAELDRQRESELQAEFEKDAKDEPEDYQYCEPDDELDMAQ